MATIKYKKNDTWKEIDASFIPVRERSAKTVDVALSNRDRVANLLDNSDFRNPVNQRRQTSYTSNDINGIYSIDRWAVRNATFDVATGTISGAIGEAYFSQSIGDRDRYLGKILTAAIKIESGSGTFAITDASKPWFWETALSIETRFDGPGVYCVSVKIPDQYKSTNLNFIMRNKDGSTSFTIEWAALYEGEYTAETLPTYVPKGHGAELAECKRYYQIVNHPYGLVPYLTTASERAYGIIFEREMRVTPTVKTIGDAVEYVAGTWSSTNAVFNVRAESPRNCIATAASTISNYLPPFAFITYEASADL